MAFRSWRAARDLSDVALLDQMGWGLSLFTWRMLKLTVAIGACAGVLTGSCIAALYALTLSGQPTSTEIVAGVLIFDIYVAVAATLRLRFGSEGENLARDPRAGFLRALDLSRVSVILAHLLPRSCLLWAVQTSLGVGVFTALNSRGSVSGEMCLSLFVAPVANAVIYLSAAVGLARRGHRLGARARFVGMLLALVVCVSAGMVVGSLMSGLGNVEKSQSVQALRSHIPVPVMLLGTLLVVSLFSALFSFRCLRGVREVSWGPNAHSSDDFPNHTAGLGTRWPTFESARSGPVRASVARLTAGVWLVSGFIFGVGITIPAVRPSVEGPLEKVALTVSLALSLMLSDLLLRHVGPISLEMHLRFAYEQGAAAMALALEVMASHLMWLIVVLGPAAIALAVLGLSPIHLLLVETACLAAGVLGASLSTAARRNERGDASGSPAAAIVAVLLSAGVECIAFSLPELLATHSLVLATLILWGGALTCVRARIIRRPLNAVTL